MFIRLPLSNSAFFIVYHELCHVLYIQKFTQHPKAPVSYLTEKDLRNHKHISFLKEMENPAGL